MRIFDSLLIHKLLYFFKNIFLVSLPTSLFYDSTHDSTHASSNNGHNNQDADIGRQHTPMLLYCPVGVVSTMSSFAIRLLTH